MTAADEQGRTVILLDEPPSLAGAYARALARPARSLATSAAGRVLPSVVRTDATPPALPDVRYRLRGLAVDPARLATYRELVHADADGPLPAGYVHVLVFPVAMALLTRDDVPLPLAGLVHVANSVTVRRAIGDDEPLTADVWAQDLRPHRRGTQVDVVAEVSDLAGTIVWRGVSTYLARGVVLDPEMPSHEASASTPEDAPLPLPTAQWRLAADVGRRYARVSGDVNPIHLSPLTAKIFGFPRTIAHGMYTAARALASTGRDHGDAFVWTVEFAKPVLLPSTVALSVVPGDLPGSWSYRAWDPRRGTPHLHGGVTPL